MTIKPVYKIEVYDPTPTLRYTLTSGVHYIYTKEVVTEGVGNFSFLVSTKKNGDKYQYVDIAVNDLVKIWLAYGSVSGNPNFVGKVTQITGGISSDEGYTRRISGLSQGLVLLNRLKKNKNWLATGASSIVTDVANDLSLGTSEIESDSTSINVEVETDRYFDILQHVSDYWVSGGTQIKKDFYVDISNNLVWKSRPFRTVGVEELTIAKNLRRATITRDVTPVKNDIKVYGKAERMNPIDGDSKTEGDTVPACWTVEAGTPSMIAGGYYGTKCLHITTGGMNTVQAYCNWDPDVSALYRKEYDRLVFAARLGSNFVGSSEFQIRLRTDVSDYFRKRITPDLIPVDDWKVGEWKLFEFGVGPKYEDQYPYSSGSPDWNALDNIWFYISFNAASYCDLDFLHYGGARYFGTASDATSKTNYGQRDLEMIDENLASDSDCGKRAETLLYQLKDPPIQLNVPTNGNTNILVGDRIPITLPSENFSAKNFDVVAVDQFFRKEPLGFSTTTTLVDTPNVREQLPINTRRVLITLNKNIKRFARGETVVTQ